MQVLTFEKAPSDNRIYGFDFYQFAELIGGDTIASAVITTPSGINVGAPSVSGPKVLAQISGGTGTAGGTYYRLTVTMTLASGAVIVGFVDIKVITPALTV